MVVDSRKQAAGSRAVADQLRIGAAVYAAVSDLPERHAKAG
jgi:hypothetical protein